MRGFAGGFIRFAAFFQDFEILLLGLVEELVGGIHVRGSVLLQIENLQLRHRCVAGIHFASFGDHGFGEILDPALFGLLHFG